MKSSGRETLLLLISLLLFFAPLSFSQASGYSITGTINIGGNSWWDYLSIDNSSHQLFVSNGNKVHIINLDNNSIIGVIDSLNGVHGAVVADKLGKGFISNGRDNSVAVFDLKTFKVLTRIPVTGKNPDAIVYDLYSKRVFTFNGRSNNVTAIDAKTNMVVGTITLNGRPEFAVSNDKGNMYVNIENKNEIVEFNPKTLKITNTWSVAPGEGPSGLAIDIKNNKLFAGCDNKMMVVVDAKTGKVIATPTIGKGVDACRFDPETHLAFSSCGEGILSVIKEVSPNKFENIDNVKTMKRARTMELDESTHNIYMSTLIPRKDNTESFGVIILKRK
jgi:YVTN family beta-propeller protein